MANLQENADIIQRISDCESYLDAFPKGKFRKFLGIWHAVSEITTEELMDSGKCSGKSRRLCHKLVSGFMNSGNAMEARDRDALSISFLSSIWLRALSPYGRSEFYALTGCKGEAAKKFEEILSSGRQGPEKAARIVFAGFTRMPFSRRNAICSRFLANAALTDSRLAGFSGFSRGFVIFDEEWRKAMFAMQSAPENLFDKMVLVVAKARLASLEAVVSKAREARGLFESAETRKRFVFGGSPDLESLETWLILRLQEQEGFRAVKKWAEFACLPEYRMRLFLDRICEAGFAKRKNDSYMVNSF